MSDNGKFAGGTPGAHFDPGRELFNYSDEAWLEIEQSLGMSLDARQRRALQSTATNFLEARTRKDIDRIERAREERRLKIADAADALIDALDHPDGELSRALGSLSYRQRAFAAASARAIPPSAAKPDRMYFLYCLCSMWEDWTLSQPTAAFRQVFRGNMEFGQKYGPAVAFLMAAGSEPAKRKGQSAISPDNAADAIGRYRHVEKGSPR